MNKKFSLIYPVIVIGLFFFTSCEDNLKSGDLNADYFPLQVGNYWEFNTIGTRSIDEIVKLDEKDYFRMIITVSWMPEKDTIYLRKTTDGKVYSRTLKSEESVLYDFKADVSQSWQNGIMRVSLSKKDGEKDLGNLKIQNCYVFYCDPRPQGADDEYSIWLAPGIGYIYEFALGGPYNQNFILKKARINGIEKSFE